MESRLSNRVKAFPPSGIRRIFDLARQPGTVSLAIGEPDFDTPVHIRAAAKAALDRGETHYSQNLGEEDLRAAIAERESRKRGSRVDPSAEVIVTIGGVEALYLAMQTALNSGDEVLIPDPGFMVYHSQSLACDARPVPYPLRIENGFYPDLSEVESLITPRTKLLVINSPGNPTGQLLTGEVLEGLAALAERHDLLVLSDEVYDTIVYDNREAISFASLPGMRERTITVNSFSKVYAMTGWRLGYAVAHPALIQGMMKLHQILAAAAPTMLQSGAVAALEGEQDFIDEMVAEYQGRRDLIVELLNRVPGFRCLKPEGAFYAFPDIRGTGMTSMELCEFLLKTVQVGCVPGSTFGANGEGFIRVSYATSRENLIEAGRRMAKALGC
ncbi:MAG: pyridoxal phosphate-dependent aminotransferase [Sphingomonadaceae bacterium]